MKSPYSFLLFIIFFSSTFVNAQLSTVVIRHDNNTRFGSIENCNGVLELNAMSDSGPFNVRIFYLPDSPNSSQRLIHEFPLNIGEDRIFESVCAGNYLVVYTNRFGCDFTDNISVTQCGRDDCCNDFGVFRSTNFEEEDSNECAGDCGMGLSVSTDPIGIGGIPESHVEYKWSNGATGNYLRELCSGSYTVTATSDFGCSASKTFTVCCAGIELSTITDAVPGGSRGSVEYMLLSDLPITRLTLNGNPINLSANRTGLNGLPPGDYTLSFQTIPGCIATIHFTISECEDLGPDTFETLPPTRDNCSALVDASMDNPFGFTYIWDDGYTRRSRSIECGETFSVTITDNRGCGEVIKSFSVCEDFEIVNLNDYIISVEPETQAGNDGQVILRLPIEFNPYLAEIYHEGTSTPVTFSNLQSSLIIRLENLTAGVHQLRFVAESGCTFLGTILVTSCEIDIDESDVSLRNIRAVGEFFNDQLTPVKIIADVEINSPFESYPFKYQLVYQHLVIDNLGRRIRRLEAVIRDSPEFYIPAFTNINGLPPTIRILRPCTVGDFTEDILSFLTVDELTSCTSPFPDVFVRDQCVDTWNLERTSYRVRGLTGGRGFVRHRIAEGDVVTVTREYRPDNSGSEGHSITYEAKVEKIETIVDPLGQNRVNVQIFGHNEKHVIKNRDTPGLLKVTIELEDGSCLEPIREIIGKRRQPPIPHILGGGDPLSERRLFRGISNDFWLGYMMNCTSCGNTELYFDGDYRDNKSCDSDRFALFEYDPNDPNRPCTGGGTLKLPPEVGGSTGAFANPVELTVYPSGRSRLLKNRQQCGCIFEPNDVEWPENGPTIGPTLRVYAEFECESSTTDEPLSIEFIESEILTLCELYGTSAECDECDVIYSRDGCGFNLICKDNGVVLRENIQRDRAGAHQGGSCFLALPNNSRQGLYDIHVGIPCEASPCDIDRWVWIISSDAVTSIEVEQYREVSGVVECPEFYCPFQSEDIGALIEGGLDNYYYKIFEQDELSLPHNSNKKFTLFPNPVSASGNLVSIIANSPNVDKWEAYDMYGLKLAQGKHPRVVGNNSEILIQLKKQISTKMIFVQVWLTSGEHYVNKIVVKP